MLRVYPSNRTESLAYVLAEIIRTDPLSDPFASETILIQSHGMGTWLQQQLSSQLGIAAMVNSMMPASFIWQLAQTLPTEVGPDGTEPIKVQQFEKSSLCWQLFEQLPAYLDQAPFQHLRDYLHSLNSADTAPTEKGFSDGQLFSLSEGLADIFDGYQNYRPDWIDAWEQGNTLQAASNTAAQQTEHWQAILWRALYPELVPAQRRHRANQLAQLKQVLSQQTLPPDLKSRLPPRLFVFGLSALPAQWLSLFIDLGRHCEVHFLIQNPCQFYWGDVLSDVQQWKLEQSMQAKGISAATSRDSFVEANPLLASWGGLGRDYLSLLYQQHDTGRVEELDVSFYEESAATTALKTLQNDILNLTAERREVSAQDYSIRFARCHSRLREVEALKDYLCDLLDHFSQDQSSHNPSSLAQEKVDAKDIIVMMPDVQDFAALIDAVFSRPVETAEGAEQYLPYGISDQALALGQPLIDVMSAILDIGNIRVTASDVSDWLDIPAIRAQFGIDEADLPQLHSWLMDLNIRWGISEAHRDQILDTQGSGAGNTWLAAFRRACSAYILGDLDAEQQARYGLVPFRLDGSDSQMLMGKLMHFIEVVEFTQGALTGRQGVLDWLEKITDIWHRWLDFDVLDEAVSQLMLNTLEQTAEHAQLAGFDQAVSFKVIAKVLEQQLQQARVSQRFLAGRINFCTLMPMRSIPFKVVCMLGMNEGQYPRPQTKVSFDLMSLTPARLGDRSRREDDRYLFLEALCSARSNLYLSYCGFDAQDNSERYPSVLVSEFRDYCAKYFALPDEVAVLEAWTTDHRLQAFHPAYFQLSDESRLKERVQSHSSVLPHSYSRDWLMLYQPRVADQSQDEALVNHKPQNLIRNDAPVCLELQQLVKAFNHPLRYYYEQNLELNASAQRDCLEDNEAFAVSGLEAYQLKQALAETWYDTSGVHDEILMQWQLTGRLPRLPAAQLGLVGIEAELEQLRGRVDALAPFNKHAISLAFTDQYVEGEVCVSRSGLLELALAKSAKNHFFGFWLRHVLWNLYLHRHPQVIQETPSLSGESQLISLDTTLVLPAIDAACSEHYALALLDYFEQIKQAPRAFLTATAFQCLFGSKAEVKNAFLGIHTPQFSSAGDCEDVYWQRACLLGELRGHDPSQLPDFSQDPLLRQVLAHIEKPAGLPFEFDLTAHAEQAKIQVRKS